MTAMGRWLGRWSIRKSMAAVLIVALSLWLGVPAYQAWRDEEWHIHTCVVEVKPASAWIPIVTPLHEIGFDYVRPSFWTRYRGRLSGPSDRTPADCKARSGGVAEACTRAHPGVVDPDHPGWPISGTTPEQDAEFQRWNEITYEQTRPKQE